MVRTSNKRVRYRWKIKQSRIPMERGENLRQTKWLAGGMRCGGR